MQSFSILVWKCLRDSGFVKLMSSYLCLYSLWGWCVLMCEVQIVRVCLFVCVYVCLYVCMCAILCACAEIQTWAVKHSIASLLVWACLHTACICANFFFIERQSCYIVLESAWLFESYEPNFGFLWQLMRILDFFAIFDPKFEGFKILWICSFTIPFSKNMIPTY